MKPDTLARVAATLVAGAALACGGRDTVAPKSSLLLPGESYAANATVRLVPLEGGCWVLDMPRGRYQPLDLPAAFRVDGLAVYAVVSPAPDAVSICMLGPVVTLDSIRQP